MSDFGQRVRRHGSFRSSSQGWIILEVMVAVVVAGILLGPLAGAMMSASIQAARVVEQAGGLPERSLDAAAMDAWVWGGLVVSAKWRPGPALEVDTRLPEGAADDAGVGLWVDGWFHGEWPTNPLGSAVIETATWSGCQGREAVLRVRTTEAAWGPPWRSLVPGFDGLVAIGPAPSAGSPGSGEAVIHPPNAGSPRLDLSWTAGPLPESLLPCVSEAVAIGPLGAALDESAQSWMMEAGRALDVYF